MRSPTPSVIALAKEEFVKTARACFAPVLWPVWLFKHLRAKRATKDPRP